jgi:ornithine carbamoyltransferase
MRHLLEIDDLNESDLVAVLDLAQRPDRQPVLAGQGVALIFEKPSNRTRNATEMAVVALGGHPVSIRGEEIGIGVRESVEDVTRVLAQYHRVLGARVLDHAVLEGMARVDELPVVNLLSDRAHPCQALADLLTLQRHWGQLAGHTLAWVGDGNNVARSVTLACGLAGVDIRLACPPGHQLDAATLDGARARGVTVTATTDPVEAVTGADAVYTDVWVSMGQEDERRQREDAFSAFQVNDALMGRAAPGAVFLHCLPAHRGLEVSASVIDGPSSVVWEQAGNRMAAAVGLLWWLVQAASDQ